MKSKFKRFFSNNGLSVVFIVLFIVCITAQFFTGYIAYNQIQEAYHLPMVSHSTYFATGYFLDAMFVNWQAAILQLGSLIFFTIFLKQRGAVHSKRRSGLHKYMLKIKGFKKYTFLRLNSLSLVFGALFLLTFMLHFYFSHKLANHLNVLSHTPVVSFKAYAFSAAFWYSNFQTWEAEFMAIALYIILSIFLRQEGSPESKPVDASNADTGEPNE